MMSYFAQLIIFLTTYNSIYCAAPLVAPYVDVLIPDQPTLREIAEATGLRGFTLAFVLARNKDECKPTWDGEVPLEYEQLITQIRDFQTIGGQVIVSTGGAMAPYLEQACNTSQKLAAAYEYILDTVNTNDLDINIEGPFNFDMMNEALAIVQKKNAKFTVSFTLITQGDDYGITDQLGIEVLKNSVKHGVRVDVVNAMTMEFYTLRPSYGDAVIQVGLSTIEQMRKVWPEKSTAQLRKMLGNSPMIGKNNNGKTYTLEHARQLIKWANNNQIGRLSFWSVGRDNGKCPNGSVDSVCSGIQQQLFEFSKIFAGFNGIPTEPFVDQPTPITTNITIK